MKVRFVSLLNEALRRKEVWEAGSKPPRILNLSQLHALATLLLVRVPVSVE